MKRLSVVLILLAMVSVANADMILTLNGVDAAKEPLEIKGKNDLIIAVSGQTQVDVNDYSITASDDSLEVRTGDYLFTFGGDSNDVLDPNVYPNLNNDQFVNFKDFAILAPNWRQTAEELDGDFDNNGTVDSYDLAVIAYYWLASTIGPSPEEVFESFKTALLADDLNAALGCFTEIAAENYDPFLEQLRPYFQQMVNDMGELVLISLDNNTAVYDVLREENGDTYGYPVLFVRDEMGQWKIGDF